VKTFGSLFAGVGGFDLGFESAGWKCAFQVEWDKHCQQILARHWPNVARWSDVSDVNGAELPPVDCITFGSPCQDLSVAGKRAGLEGGRSGLFFEATRIIREMRDATGNKYPRVAVWENVAGAFSSNQGADFAAVLDSLADIGALAIEWHLLDAQWFGVPQRRRRIFLAAVFDPATAERGGSQIFAVGEGRRRNLAASVKKRKKSSRTFGEDTAIGFSHTQGLDCQPSTVAFPTLRSEGNGHAVMQPLLIDGRRNDDVRVNQEGICRTLEARMGTGGNNIPVVSYAKVVKSGPRDKEGNLPAEVLQERPVAPTLTTTENGHPDRATVLVQSEYEIRRLTPIECERLMGWPDDHTRWRADGKEQTDGHRYKQCGNGVAAPVAKWVAGQLNKVMDNV
jgi:DNA (cytosine-5)-methyltransferase 1